eukprot:gene10894-3598_t
MDEIEAAKSLAILSTPVDDDESDHELIIEEEKNREWQVLTIDETILKEKENFLTISCKTRTEAPQKIVPNRMYSSLKYELNLVLKNSSFVGNPLPFVICQISVVDPFTNVEVIKNNQTVLKEKTDSVLNQLENKDYQGKLKVQFTNVSYHREKKEYCWKIKFFDPKDLNKVILSMKSGSFRVYARKPNTSVTKKRKKENLQEEIDELIEIHKKLTKKEKETVLESVKLTFISIDPKFMQ